MAVKKLPAESWVTFLTRTVGAIRTTLTDMGVDELLARVVRRMWTWAGHVCRLENDDELVSMSSTASTTGWRRVQAVGETHDRTNRCG